MMERFDAALSMCLSLFPLCLSHALFIVLCMSYFSFLLRLTLSFFLCLNLSLCLCLPLSLSLSLFVSLCVSFSSFLQDLFLSDQNMDFDDTGVQRAPAQSDLICKKPSQLKNTLRYLYWSLLRLHQLLRGISTGARHSLLHF